MSLEFIPQLTHKTWHLLYFFPSPNARNSHPGLGNTTDTDPCWFPSPAYGRPNVWGCLHTQQVPTHLIPLIPLIPLHWRRAQGPTTHIQLSPEPQGTHHQWSWTEPDGYWEGQQPVSASPRLPGLGDGDSVGNPRSGAFAISH